MGWQRLPYTVRGAIFCVTGRNIDVKIEDVEYGVWPRSYEAFLSVVGKRYRNIGVRGTGLVSGPQVGGDSRWSSERGCRCYSSGED